MILSRYNYRSMGVNVPRRITVSSQIRVASSVPSRNILISTGSLIAAGDKPPIPSLAPYPPRRSDFLRSRPPKPCGAPIITPTALRHGLLRETWTLASRPLLERAEPAAKSAGFPGLLQLIAGRFVGYWTLARYDLAPAIPLSPTKTSLPALAPKSPLLR